MAASSSRAGSYGAALALAATLVVATPAHAQQGFTHRLTMVLYDYDNNGVTDATSTITYGAGGRPTDLSYVYTGDGVPDLFVTEDDDAASEAGVIGFNPDDLLDSFSLERQLMQGGSEEFDTVLTFVAGQLTRVDSDSMTGGMTNSTFTTLSYTGDQLDQIEERNTSNNSLVFEQFYAYGSDDLPSVVTFESSGIDAVTSLSWRPDGQVDDLSTTVTFDTMPLGGGAADFVYDAEGFLQSEAWSMTGSVGSLFAEFQGVTYRKSVFYDAGDLKIREEVDIGDDGSVEATRTFVWEAGPCVLGFLFAANGRPNFARMDGLPYVPGTGATSVENCGPVIVPQAPPVPALALPLQLALVGALAGLGGLWAQRRL